MKKKCKFPIYLGLSLLLLTGCGREETLVLTDSLTETAMEETEETCSTSLEETATGTILVYVCGAVEHPGVYELTDGDRVVDALSQAGGALSDAHLDSLNLAQKLTDGAKIQVFTTAEVEQGLMTDSGMDGKININTATAKELTKLSGIGDSKAQAIVSYREEHGSFTAIEDIKKVQGIGEGLFSRIAESITV